MSHKTTAIIVIKLKIPSYVQAEFQSREIDHSYTAPWVTISTDTSILCAPIGSWNLADTTEEIGAYDIGCVNIGIKPEDEFFLNYNTYLTHNE